MRHLLLAILLTGCVDYGFTPADDDPPLPVDTSVPDDVQPESALVVMPDQIDFGEVSWDESVSAVLTLQNVGVVPLDLTGVVLEGQSDAFALGPPGATSLPPGQSTEAVITYTPGGTDEHEDAVLVSSTASVDPTWTVPLSGQGFRDEWDVNMQITADDQWTGTLDGDPIGGSGQNAWSTSDVLQFTLGSGEHVIAVHAQDVGRVIAGFLAVVRVDGEPIAYTGDGAWSVSMTPPLPGWQLPGFDDNSWATPGTCANPSPWGGQPTSLTDDGADWVWHTTNCQSLGEAWFRLSFTLE